MNGTARIRIWFATAVALLGAGAGLALPEEIDRVLAAVNGKIIAVSDLKVALDLNSLLVFGKSANGAALSKKEELDRLMDLELIRQELESFPIASEDLAGLEAQMDELKKGYAEIGGLGTIMRRLGLQEEELQSYIRLRASIDHFVHLRFRPFVSISQSEVESYYNGELVPPLKRAGSAVPPLAEVSSRIEQILVERKVNSALDRWIKDLRSHSRIELFPGEGKPGTGSPGDGKSAEASLERSYSSAPMAGLGSLFKTGRLRS